MIRQYKEVDLSQVIKLLRANTPLFFAPSEEADFKHYLEKEREDYFVYEEQGKILACGGINYFQDENLCRISWDIVDPRNQGKGIGRQLVDFRLQYISEQKMWEKVVVRTSQHVYRFYEKMGFSLKKITQDYWAPDYDLYVMEKES